MVSCSVSTCRHEHRFPGGALFNSVREEADDLFVKLPPPSQKVDSFDWGAWGDVGAGVALSTDS